MHTPDLYAGRTFDTLDDGVAYAAEIGFGEVIERGVRAADELPDGLVYAGSSLGVLPAQKLAQTRPGARGALLFHSCVPTSEFGASWPAGVPVQVHAMEADPWFVAEGDLAAARAIVESAGDAELYLYPGDRHLFADSSLSSHDAVAAALLNRRDFDVVHPNQDGLGKAGAELRSREALEDGVKGTDFPAFSGRHAFRCAISTSRPALARSLATVPGPERALEGPRRALSARFTFGRGREPCRSPATHLDRAPDAGQSPILVLV